MSFSPWRWTLARWVVVLKIISMVLVRENVGKHDSERFVTPILRKGADLYWVRGVRPSERLV